MGTLPLFVTFARFVNQLNWIISSITVAGSLDGSPSRSIVGRLNLGSESTFGRLLRALVSLGTKSGPRATNAVIGELTRWRGKHLHAGGRENFALVCAVEILFCTAVLRLLVEPGCLTTLPQRLRNDLEEETSTQLVRRTNAQFEADNAQPSASIPKHLGSKRWGFSRPNICVAEGEGDKTNHPIANVLLGSWSDNDAVAELYARVLGLLSQRSVLAVTARFLPRLNASLSPGQTGRHATQAVATVHMMRYVQLGIYSEQQLEVSLDFLTKIANVMDVARSSERKHELCALLAACLERLPTKMAWESGLNYCDWDAIVLRLFDKVKSWAAKAKHAIPCCRAMAALLAVFSDKGTQQMRELIAERGVETVQMLQKHCRDKATRGSMLVGLRCILASKLALVESEVAPANMLQIAVALTRPNACPIVDQNSNAAGYVMKIQEGLGQIIETFHDKSSRNVDQSVNLEHLGYVRYHVAHGSTAHSAPVLCT